MLIVALGILGLVGLQARAMQSTDESQFRIEAAFLASDVVSRMWISDPNTLIANFTTGGGTPYADFKTVVDRQLPGAAAINPNPTITVVQRGATPASGFDVLVTVFWQPPSYPPPYPPHQYQMAATVRMN